MAWYHDKARTTYVATYKDEKTMRKEVEEAAKFGWVPQGTAGTGGHINVGRTAARVALTGGLGLLFGTSRSKDKVTITFVRDERWLASTEAEDARRTLEERRAKFQKASEELSRAEELFKSRVEGAAQSQDLDRARLEKDVNKALKELIEARESANRHRQQLPTALSSARDTYARAANMGAEAARLSVDPDQEIDKVTQEMGWNTEKLQQERELHRLQEEIVRAAENWQKASEERQEAQSKLGKAVNQLAEAHAAAEAASTEQAEKATRKLRDSEEEQAKRQREIEGRDDELDTCAASLRNLLDQRAAFLARRKEQPTPIAASEPQIPAPPPPELLRAEGAASGEVLAQIEKLAELHRAGVLTDEEFATKKAELLSRL